MDSREDSSALLNTFGDQYQASELDSDTTGSTAFTSISSILSGEVYEDDRTHINGCQFRFTNICVCRALTRIRMKEERRLAQQNSTLNSTILAGNVGVMSSSYTSSGTYHSAESSAVENETEAQKSTSEPSESFLSRMNTAVIEPRRRDNNYNINSQKLQKSQEKNESSPELEDETSYMEPFLEKLAREIEKSDLPNEPRKKLVRRLSAHFARDPDGVMERLLTIIEETDLTDDLQARLDSRSALNLSRLTTEFRKGCKYLSRNSITRGDTEEAIADCTAPSFMFHNSFADMTLQNNSQMSNQSPPIGQRRRSSVGFTTPTNENNVKQQKKYPKTPRMANCSPFRMAALKNASGSPMPVKPSKNMANDSFAFWEAVAEQIATPEKENKNKIRRSISMPNIDARLKMLEIKKKAATQLEALTQSPTATINSNDNSTATEYDTFDSHKSPNYNLGDSIIEEVMKKRARCYETERTLREIEANSTSGCSDDESYVLKYFEQIVGRASDYHKYLISNKDEICTEIKRKLTPKAKKPVAPKTPRNPLQSRNINRSVRKVQPAAAKTPNNHNRPSFIVNIRKKSPVILKSSVKSPALQKSINSSVKKLSSGGKTPSKTLSSTRTPSKMLSCPKTPSDTSTRTPSRTLLSVRTPSKSQLSVKTSSAPRTPSKPLSSSKLTLPSDRTPSSTAKINSNYLSTVRTPSRLTSAPKTPSRVTSASKTPSRVTSAPKTPSRVASAPKTPSRVATAPKTPLRVTSAPKTPSKVISSSKAPSLTYKTPSRFLKTRSPAKLSISSRSSAESRSNSMTDKLHRTPRMTSKTPQKVPSVQITPATPAGITKTSKKSSLQKSPSTIKKSSLTSKKSPSSKKLTSSKKELENVDVPFKIVEKPGGEQVIIYESSVPKPLENRAKFFPVTPGTTTRKIQKQGKYFNTPNKYEAKSNMQFPRSAIYFGWSTVKSPVGEYIRSADARFTQRAFGERNDLAMEPKKFVETKKNRDFCEAHEENTENTPDRPTLSHFPNVQTPSSTSKIICKHQSPVNKKRILREINDRQIIAHHQRSEIDNSTDESMHYAKATERADYV